MEVTQHRRATRLGLAAQHHAQQRAIGAWQPLAARPAIRDQRRERPIGRLLAAQLPRMLVSAH